MSTKTEDPLALAAGLTAKTQQLCLGLESGAADILELVTPTTAELLKWWFQTEFQDARTFNFHPGQRQALLNVIYAHEVLGMTTLKGLYQEIAPEVLIASDQAAQIIVDEVTRLERRVRAFSDLAAEPHRPDPRHRPRQRRQL